MNKNPIQITKNFNFKEFCCHCYDCNYLDSCIEAKLIQKLQLIRDYFNRPVSINSAYRCSQHNQYVGGSKNSQHLKGFAADIVVQGILPNEVQDHLIKNQDKLKLTVGRYDSFTHVDVRETPIVFDKRSK